MYRIIALVIALTFIPTQAFAFVDILAHLVFAAVPIGVGAAKGSKIKPVYCKMSDGHVGYVIHRDGKKYCKR